MGLVEDHKAHATKVAGCLICEARKDWGAPIPGEPGYNPQDHTIHAGHNGGGAATKARAAAKARKPKFVIVPDEPRGHVIEATPVVYTTREAWMVAAVEALTPWYVDLGHEVPPVRVSIGWPGGRSDATVLGSCWAKESVKDGKAMIFVSPVQDDPVEVLETIAHELIHAINHAWGHGAEFKKVAKALGITNGGVCKTNRAESPDLYARLDVIAAALGTFPHSAIGTRSSAGTITGTFTDPVTGKRINPRNGKPVQGTRMLKVVCPEDGYTVRTTSRWLAVGNPSCPAGHEMVAVQS